MTNALRYAALTLSLCSALHAQAQDNNYDALARTFSQTGPVGSARFQALGGPHAALGADASTLAGNPAGLGFYSRSEINFTPGVAFQTNKTEYLGQTRTDSKGNVNLANIGVIFAGSRSNPVGFSRWKGAFGLGYTRSFNLSNAVTFGGTNNKSSLTDSFADLANTEQKGGTPVGDFFSDFDNNRNNGTFDFPTSAYYFGSLIIPSRNAQGQSGPPYSGAEPSKTVNQTFGFKSSGATSQWTAAYGANYDDKLYLGASIGYVRMNYSTTKTSREDFNNPDQIKGFTYDQTLNTRGGGFNLSLGAIFRPVEFLRIGASITTPTGMAISETSESSLLVDLARPVDLGPTSQQNPTDLNLFRQAGFNLTSQNGRTYIAGIPRLAVKPYDSNYKLRTPFKANGGVAVFFGKSAFISGNVEYVAFEGMRLTSDDQNADGGLRDGSYTAIVKRAYQNVLNYKLGGEYRYQHFHLRAGWSYYGDPYKETFDKFDRARTIYSAGVGYRDEKFYVDVAGLYGQSANSYSPYVLNNPQDYASAKINNSTSQVILSVGTYF